MGCTRWFARSMECSLLTQMGWKLPQSHCHEVSSLLCTSLYICICRCIGLLLADTSIILDSPGIAPRLREQGCTHQAWEVHSRQFFFLGHYRAWPRVDAVVSSSCAHHSFLECRVGGKGYL